MKLEQARVGTKVKSLIQFFQLPKGTEGIIDEDYGTGIMVAWDLIEHPLPKGYNQFTGISAIRSRILRDGFNKETELKYLEIVK